MSVSEKGTSLQVISSETAIGHLLSEEDRELLYRRKREERQKETPKKHIQMKGGFPFAEYAYMLDEMDKMHPLRSEIVISAGTFFNEKYLIYHVAVQVTDLITGESRPGTDAHPVVAYEAGRDGDQKPIQTIRELMGNAYKAALTKALRNAYSNFGVSSDLYQTQLAEEPNKEQKERFWEWDKFMDEKVLPTAPDNWKEWWETIRKEWDLQTLDSATDYLNSLEPRIAKIKEKYNV
jgi:hypothetical protein